MRTRQLLAVLVAALWLAPAGVVAAQQSTPVGQAAAAATRQAAPASQQATSAALQAPPDAETLAKAAQNPLATLVTLPLQANYNTGTGAYGRTFFNFNVQPVVPIPGEKWNVIVRTILPINSMPQGEVDSTFGFGDATMQLFFSPNKSGAITWGVGPVLRPHRTRRSSARESSASVRRASFSSLPVSSPTGVSSATPGR